MTGDRGSAGYMEGACCLWSTTRPFADIFDAIAATLNDTGPEPDLEELLWSAVHIFHRMVGQVERTEVA